MDSLTFQHKDGRLQAAECGSALCEALAGDPAWTELDTSEPKRRRRPRRAAAAADEVQSEATTDADAGAEVLGED